MTIQHRKIVVVISILITLVVFLTRCIDKKESARDPRGNFYAGAAACVSCHKDIMQSWEHSNHYKTSSQTSYDELKKFAASSNDKVYYEDSSQVGIEEKGSAFFQTYTDGGKLMRSEPMEIAFGSAEKAQTYAYWKEEQLLQLPLTYFSAKHAWINSPGYPVMSPYFERVILSRCLECHASYVHKTTSQAGPLQITEKLSRQSIVFGIDCERCHGPAAAHVKFHELNPAIRQARFITSIKSLGRQQQLDLCASCHSGNDLDVQRSMFSFRPGDTLANFYYPHFGSGSSDPDVHGKQMQLLQASKCFQLSTMTCLTCHGAHDGGEKGQDVFVAKCLNCHQQSPHAREMKTASKTCIDCHMPLQASKTLDFNNGVEKTKIPYWLRTHRIAIYPATE